MNNKYSIRYEVEGQVYKSTPENEQSIFRLMKKLHKPESIVIVRESDGSILDELPMDALI